MSESNWFDSSFRRANENKHKVILTSSGCSMLPPLFEVVLKLKSNSNIHLQIELDKTEPESLSYFKSTFKQKF